MSSIISGTLRMYTNGAISGTRVAIAIIKNKLLEEPDNKALAVCLGELNDELKQQESNLEIQRSNHRKSLSNSDWGDPL